MPDFIHTLLTLYTELPLRRYLNQKNRYYYDMKKKSDTQKRHTGDKKRIYEYLKEHKTARTRDLVYDLEIDAKKVWKITNELEAEGVIFTTL